MYINKCLIDLNFGTSVVSRTKSCMVMGTEWLGDTILAFFPFMGVPE